MPVGPVPATRGGVVKSTFLVILAGRGIHYFST